MLISIDKICSRVSHINPYFQWAAWNPVNFNIAQYAHSIPKLRVETKYHQTGKTAPSGSRIIAMNIPRPSETLIFDRHLDHLKLNFVNAAERWKNGNLFL